MVCNQLLLGLACHSSDGFPPVGVFGLRIMPDRFSSGLPAALNDSVEVKESDWNSIAAVFRGPIKPPDTPRAETTYAVSPGKPFAATISSGMAWGLEKS